jgi:two-component system sensor histidine kinase AlgZ
MSTPLGTTPAPAAPAPEQPLWRVVTDAIKAAPPMQRRGLFWSPLPIVTALGIGVADIVSGTNRLEIYRLSGLVLASTGYTLLLVAHVLHYLSQIQKPDCKPRDWPFFRLESRVPSRLFMAIPVMSCVAAALLASAIALYIPSVLVRPKALLLLPFFIWLLVIAVRTVAHTSRFLYTWGERQAALAARAESEAADARLAALQAQMNPHFLFNALNTVAALVRTNPGTAERTVEHLADVLRRTLARTSRTSGTLDEELEYLKAYLAVEQQRYGERLKVSWTIADETRRLSLPPLLLQPLVENALKHGLGARLEGGHLAIAAARDGDSLRLSVTDDGAGLPTRSQEGTGIGNLRRRLATLYGDRAHFTLEQQNGSTVATLDLPVGA